MPLFFLHMQIFFSEHANKTCPKGAAIVKQDEENLAPCSRRAHLRSKILGFFKSTVAMNTNLCSNMATYRRLKTMR